ncbi:MAG: hypothetical protein EBT51_11040 [Flavobacteriaceae bacterium]|nr:hypothetical protein [Flavobacteriaceae bacterium]
MMYKVFHRTWWRENKDWPNGLEPHVGKSHYICKVKTEDEAIIICEAWNDIHDAGRYSDKAEYTEI